MKLKFALIFSRTETLEVFKNENASVIVSEFIITLSSKRLWILVQLHIYLCNNVDLNTESAPIISSEDFQTFLLFRPHVF